MFSLLVLTDFPRTLCLYFSSAVQFSMTGRPGKVTRRSLSIASLPPFSRQLDYYNTFVSPCQHFFRPKSDFFRVFFAIFAGAGFFPRAVRKVLRKTRFFKNAEFSDACHAVRPSVPARLKENYPGGDRGPRPGDITCQLSSAGERVFYDHGMMVARPVAVDHLVAHPVKRYLDLVADNENEVDRRRGLPV